jgi:hypothetical protein
MAVRRFFGTQSAQRSDTEFTEEKPFVFSVNSVSALCELRDLVLHLCRKKQPFKAAGNHFSGAGQLLTKIRGKILARAAGLAPCIV